MPETQTEIDRLAIDVMVSGGLNVCDAEIDNLNRMQLQDRRDKSGQIDKWRRIRAAITNMRTNLLANLLANTTR